MATVNSSYHSSLLKPTANSSSLTSSSRYFSLSPKLFITPNPNPRFQLLSSLPTKRFTTSVLKKTRASAMAAGVVQEVLPPALTSSSEAPSVFDGTTRLYISYTCPYAQRTWITRNCKGLQEKIKLVPIDLQNRPDWYKEKVYPPNKVPSLEHNNEVKGESLDLIKYIDSNFEGPSLSPDDPAKKEFAEELFSYTGSFSKSMITYFKEDAIDEAAAALDYIETALSKFDDGPFFLGQFSLVDIAYAPFIERFRPFILDVKNYDITEGRPKLSAWIEEMDKIDGYKQTKRDQKELVESYKKRFSSQS